MAGLINSTTKKTSGGLINASRSVGSLAPKADLSNSGGLYNLAVQSGLQGDADRIRAKNQGESRQIFSGGVISDLFDGLNALDYGVVGLLKGKGFAEGVKSRQSFSDKDALGNFGITGTVLGTVLDIAVDPLTYIPPLAIAKRIPLVSKLAKAGKTAIFGEKVIKTVAETGKAFETVEGGTKIGKYLADKFAYGFGKDPQYMKLLDRSVGNIGNFNTALKKLTQGVIDLPKEKLGQLLSKDKTGRFIRKPLEALTGFSNKELETVADAYKFLDNLGEEAVRVGLLKKGTFEENVGQYLKSAYEEYELSKKAGIFGSLKNKVMGIKARKDLTPEAMKALGQIDNPGYLLWKSSFDLIKDIENTKFFNEVAEKFGSKTAQEGFEQLPESRRLFTTATGKKIEMFGKIKNLNEQLKPAFKELRKTFSADRETLSKISNLEKELTGLSGMRIEEFNKFFNEGEIISKLSPARTTIKGVGKLPERLYVIGDKLRKFNKLDEGLASDIGKELQRAYDTGLLERAGFKDAKFMKGDKEITVSGLKQFFNFVKKPFKQTAEKIIEKPLIGDISKLIDIQKQIENLVPKLGNLKGIDKRSIDDSFRFLEDTISKINLEKEGAFEQIGKLKLGELSGKWLPKAIHSDLTALTTQAGEIEKIMRPITSTFKFMKVVMNPASNVRNIISNKLLNNFDEAGMPLWRLDKDMQGWASVLKKDKWYKEVEKLGGAVDTFSAQELEGLLDPKVFSSGMRNGLNKAKEFFSGIYQREEMSAKMSMYIYQRTTKKLGEEEAWNIAERATFNYAQVTPFIRKLRSNFFGFPFITFTVKSTPVIAKVIATKPTKLSNIGKIRNAIENMADIKETERERAAEPSWVKNGFYVKLPMKDKHGRSAYFDLTYILPFGDLVNLGDADSLNLFSKSPGLNLIKEIGSNQDFFKNKIWRESDSSEKQLGDLMRHLSKTFLPPPIADQLPGGYKESTGERISGRLQQTTEASSEDQKRTLMQEMLRNVGLKVQPLDADIQETYQEWNLKRDLEELLNEKGVTKEFTRTYIPN